MVVSAKLENWDDLLRDGPWPALLVGNGASQAVWPDFGYSRLYSLANLTRADEDLFAALEGTRNFEIVLDALRVSRIVCEQLGHHADDVDDRYESIKEALITAVNDVHAPWTLFSGTSQCAVGDELITYGRVYSTNYDLLLYWGLRGTSDQSKYGDYFWNPGCKFDIDNIEPRWPMTMIHYLHGGLHIYRTPRDATYKRTSSYGATLLDLLGLSFRGVDLPLFVSEGTSSDKMRVIRSSEYLSFAYQKLVDESESIAIFGHSLGSNDQHLVEAIRRHPDRALAISIHHTTKLKVIEQKTRLKQLFPGSPLRFFDSTTHPLGAPRLNLSL